MHLVVALSRDADFSHPVTGLQNYDTHNVPFVLFVCFYGARVLEIKLNRFYLKFPNVIVLQLVFKMD
jgi:hypothetical protein